MCPYPYYEIMRKSKDQSYLRYRMALSAKEIGIKPTARLFGTTPKTVRKWLNRFEKDGFEGLKDQSRSPKHPPCKISPQQEAVAIALKKQLPSFGARRIKILYHLTISEKALLRIWRKAGLIRRKRKKHQTKKDLREIKSKWRLFEQVEIDTKNLDDIPELWTQIQRLSLPKIQYTFREVVSGLQFIAFAQERSISFATLFAQLVLNHLKECGAKLTPGRWQTDNGSEFIGAWNAKQDSIFTKTIEQIKGLEHHTIPPSAHRWQADIETVHRLIEDEFYEVEKFKAREDFLAKTYSYILWFNLARKNSYKKDKTPWEIMHNRDPTISKKIVNFPPVFLDELFIQNLDKKRQGGYHVIQHP